MPGAGDPFHSRVLPSICTVKAKVTSSDSSPRLFLLLNNTAVHPHHTKDHVVKTPNQTQLLLGGGLLLASQPEEVLFPFVAIFNFLP